MILPSLAKELHKELHKCPTFRGQVYFCNYERQGKAGLGNGGVSNRHLQTTARGAAGVGNEACRCTEKADFLQRLTSQLFSLSRSLALCSLALSLSRSLSGGGNAGVSTEAENAKIRSGVIALSTQVPCPPQDKPVSCLLTWHLCIHGPLTTGSEGITCPLSL